MDEGPRLTGTRTTIICVATQRTRLYEDGSDYEWSYVKLDGSWIAIPPDSRAGTFNP